MRILGGACSWPNAEHKIHNTQAGVTEKAIQDEFHIGHVTSVLGISLYVAGLGSGPLLLGPLSEFYGRNKVYWVSLGLCFLLNFPVAFANNPGECPILHNNTEPILTWGVAVHLIFRFFSGMAGSAFLSVAGGSVSDLFNDTTVAKCVSPPPPPLTCSS